MRGSPMTTEELAMAKDSLVRSLPSDFQTSGNVTASTANIYIFDLGLDYFSKYPERLSAVTIEQAKAAAEKYLAPDKMVVVAVGDRAKIQPALQKLNLGSPEIRSADGSIASATRATQ
jgi:zinc protease